MVGPPRWPATHSTSARDALYQARLSEIAVASQVRSTRSLELLKAQFALEKARADHDLAEASAREEATRAAAAAEDDADRASSAAYSAAVLDVAKGSHERARGSAEFVQKAATAIFGLYTGALTLSFSVTEAPLPVRGLLPSVFLGLAVVLATGYLAYLTRGGSVPDPQHAQGREQAELERVRTFVVWTRNSTMVRVWMLRASVIALAVGTIVLPLPFLTLATAAPDTATQDATECTAPLVRDPATGACIVPWPDPPPASAGPVELRELLYQAQVEEAAVARDTARETAASAPAADDSWVLWWVGGVGLALVLVVPALTALGSWIVRSLQQRAARRTAAS